MSTFTAIDLEKLPPPEVLEMLDFEAVLAEIKADLVERAPHLAAALELESDDMVKVLEACAYREIVLRQRINDAAKSVMLAFARGPDLDHLGALYGVTRKTIDPGDADAVPPVSPTREDDANYQRRIQLAPEAFTVAGSVGAYTFHGLTAGQDPVDVTIASPTPGVVTVTYSYASDSIVAAIKDASVVSPTPGDVTVTILGHEGDGVLPAETVTHVACHISADHVRPLTDRVTLQSGQPDAYSVSATLSLYDGPDEAIVQAEAEKRFWKMAADRHRLGETVTSSVIDAALHVPGVRSVTLDGWQDIDSDAAHAPYCAGLDLTLVSAA